MHPATPVGKHLQVSSSFAITRGSQLRQSEQTHPSRPLIASKRAVTNNFASFPSHCPFSLRFFTASFAQAAPRTLYGGCSITSSSIIASFALATRGLTRADWQAAPTNGVRAFRQLAHRRTNRNRRIVPETRGESWIERVVKHGGALLVLTTVTGERRIKVIQRWFTG